MRFSLLSFLTLLFHLNNNLIQKLSTDSAIYSRLLSILNISILNVNIPTISLEMRELLLNLVSAFAFRNCFCKIADEAIVLETCSITFCTSYLENKHA